MAPIITKAGIPYTSYQGASAEELTGNPSFMWTGGFPGVLAGMAKYAVANGAKAVTLFVTDAPAVTGGAAAFGDPAFKAAGVKLNIVPIPLGTPDATPQVSAGVKGDPGAIGIVGDATMCTSTLKALGTVGYKGDKLVISQCLDPSVQKAAGDALEGSKVLSTTDGITDDPEAKLYRAVMAKYAPSDATVTGAAETGFQSMLGFIRAASDGITDPSAPAVISAIKGAKEVTLPLGHGATFTCDGTALPGLTAVCSNASLVGTWTDGTIADYQLLP
jgi:branched-chain amino acid transport system substrate-binding protein